MSHTLLILAAAFGTVSSYHFFGFDRHVRFAPYAVTFALGVIALAVFTPLLLTLIKNAVRAFATTTARVIAQIALSGFSFLKSIVLWPITLVRSALKAGERLGRAIGARFKRATSRLTTLPARTKMKLFALNFVLKQNRRLRAEIENLRADNQALNSELKGLVNAWDLVRSRETKPTATPHAPFSRSLTIETSLGGSTPIEFVESALAKMPELIETVESTSSPATETATDITPDPTTT